MLTEIKSRWKAETPKFFKAVIKISVAMCGLSATILSLKTSFDLSPVIDSACKNMMVIGTTAAFISKLTIEQADGGTVQQTQEVTPQTNSDKK